MPDIVNKTYPIIFIREENSDSLEKVPYNQKKFPTYWFYIRDADTGGSFSEDFAQPDVQASGLFVPADVGIDLFDGY